MYDWFQRYDDFAGGVDFAYWWSCIGKGLRLQPAQQACYKRNRPCAALRYWEQDRIAPKALNFATYAEIATKNS